MFVTKGNETRSSDTTSARVLFVPGFVADTYSEIEKSYVELCANTDHNIEYLWLVPDITCKLNTFAKPESRMTLKEPAWVPHLRNNKIPYVVVNLSSYNLFTNYRIFHEIFHKHKIDAVYTHFGTIRFWAAFMSNLFRKVTIWNEHWYSLGGRFNFLKRLFYWLFVDEFISISEFITTTLPHHARVHTVLNGIWPQISRKMTRNEAEKFREQIGIKPGTTVILMVAQFTPQKRHDLALEICRRVSEVRKDVFFIFLGKGTTREPFLDKARKLGLEQKIFAPGYVNDVDNYYSIADASILTSYHEGFGYAVLEAMKHALPVTAFDTGGPAEVIRNGETGILVKDADVNMFTQKLIELIDNKSLREKIGESAREAVQQEYNREIWIKSLNTILEEIVMRRRAQRINGD
jgi:glycosyltransferase involved in cell wall biosynthesis